jgi:glycosyltransferase involved in cell wall biosynthesis
MGEKLKIAIAIPTYNRLEKLKFALSKIEAQEIDDRFELYCVISNIASTDGTTEFLNQLSHKNINYVIWNKPEENIYLNWRRCSEAIPEDIDWVWLNGDDDFLTNDQVIKGLVNIIEQNACHETSLIHICQARRSRSTGSIIKDNLFDLCNQLGYHEILGWMSSLVVRRSSFKRAIDFSTLPCIDFPDPKDQVLNKYSAYPHSAGLLRSCHNDRALFVDEPWVEPQDEQQTEECIARWAEAFTGDRYFYVIDDLLAMYDEGILQKKCRLNFFRYLQYSFWDRYATFLIQQLVQKGCLSELNKEHLNSLHKISELLENPRENKIFLQWYTLLCMQVVQYEKAHQEVTNLQNQLVAQFDLTQSHTYTFEVLNEQGGIFD